MAKQYKGIDVSKWQRKIDWTKVKADFVIIRCGWANTDGSLIEDSYFKANMEGAAAAGIPVGVYVYSYVNRANAKKMANAVLEMVKPYKLELPLIFDFEDKKYHSNSKAENTAIISTVLETWENAGYYAMWYTFKSFANSYVDADALQRFDFWLAHYTKKTDYHRPYGMWQYASNGKIDGISGNVDMNIAYKDYPALIRSKGLNRISAIDIVFDDLTYAAAQEIKTFADAAGIRYTERKG